MHDDRVLLEKRIARELWQRVLPLVHADVRPLSFVAGSSRMPYGRFLVFNAAGAILWATGVVLLGYFLGASWQLAEQWIGRAALALFAVVAGSLVLWLRRRARRKVGDPPSA